MAGNSKRSTINYKNLSEKYSKYVLENCSSYLTRLKQMESLLLDRIKVKWGNKYPVRKLCKLSEKNSGKTVVIGNLFKRKSSVLKQLAEGNQFTDDSVDLFIEDELQRYHILGALDGEMLVTGITCALLGTYVGKGKFTVEDYVFAGYRPQIERPLISNNSYIVFLSGLDFANHEELSLNFDMITLCVLGLIPDTLRIVRIVIAGNCVRTKKDLQKKQTQIVTLTQLQTQTLSMTNESSHTIEAVKELDSFLKPLCEVVDVDLMPGEFDPSNHIMPQKQLDQCMFPQSVVYKSFHLVTNPYCCSVDGVKILGTSGQPISDILKISDITDPLEALENCLKWNHLAPTAPDTLSCYAFHDSDPFIIDDCPHVLFAGNQTKFGTKTVKGPEGQSVCLISIPQFSKTFEVCLLNLTTMNCKPLFLDA